MNAALAPWKSTRSEAKPFMLAAGSDAVSFTTGMTRSRQGMHLALIANGYARRRSLCGYHVVPHPDGEASMSEWDARCCPQCAGIASQLTHKRVA